MIIGWRGPEGWDSSLCQISSKSVNPLRRYCDFSLFFQDGGRPPSWICWGNIWTIHEEYLVISITVQNLVMIDAVVSIIWAFQYLVHLAGKHLFMPPKLGLLGYLSPKMGCNINESQKRHTLAWVRIIWAKHENLASGLTCRSVA